MTHSHHSCTRRRAIREPASWLRPRRALIALALGAFTMAALQLEAAGDEGRGGLKCMVPSGSYPTISDALAGPCDSAVLSTGDYDEALVIDRAFDLLGPEDFSARILGDVQVNTTAPVSLRNVTFAAAAPDTGEIFSDGFETGDVSAWS